MFLRIPEISVFDNHPFTIASIMRYEDDLTSPSSRTTIDTSSDLKQDAKSESRLETSEKDEYNDMVLVFKPYQGFTRKVYDISRKMNDVSYKVLLDGPYGGMPRKLESFDTVLLIAGGSGITPVVAHLQDLCRNIRRGKAVTQDVRVVWTVKRFESLEWFKDEISAAARSVPWGLVHCQYFVTEESPVEFCDFPISATQQWPTSPAIAGFGDSPGTSQDGDRFPMPALPGTAITTPEKPESSTGLPVLNRLGDRLLPATADRAPRLPKPVTTPLQTTFITPDTSDIVDSHPNPFTTPVGPPDADDIFHHTHPEITDTHPNPFSTPTGDSEKPQEDTAPPSDSITTIPPHARKPSHSKKPSLRVSTVPEIRHEQIDGIYRATSPPLSGSAPNVGPDGKRLSYGPGDFGDEVMIEFGRPRLREGVRPWAEGFGRRTCIYVCGPESMKIDVSNAVASLQHDIWRRTNQDREEVYLHTETFGY